MDFLKIFVTILFITLSGLAFAAAPDRPNIVFILADDLGVMDVGAFNPNTFYETPNIDRLAAEGMRFTAGYTTSNVCSPTRYSIMSGRYPVRSGITNFLVGVGNERFEAADINLFMPLEEITLGEAFQEAGYRTAYLGKWHLGSGPQYAPQHQGFEVVGGDFQYICPSIKGLKLPERERMDRQSLGELYIETRTQWITEDALQVLEAFKDEPFLLYLSLYQVHTPFGASEKYIAPFRKKKTELGLQDNATLDFVEEEQVQLRNRPRLTRLRQNSEVYAGMVAHTDSCVGLVLDKLDALGLKDNTIVFFMTDNGGLATVPGHSTSNIPFRTGKGWLYEGGIRGPLIVRLPNIVKPNSICDTPVICTDFYPTLLEAAKLPLKPEQHLDGVSFMPLLRGEKMASERDALYWHYPHYGNAGGFPSSAIRMGQYKLIQRLEDGRVHLYDLESDRGEQKDLAAEMPEKVVVMQKRLFQWYKETGARFLKPKNGEAPWVPEQL